MSLPAESQPSLPGARDRRAMLVAQGLKRDSPVTSIRSFLEEIGLSKYYCYFRDAGIDVVDSYAYKTDEEIHTLLSHVESANKIILPRKHFVKLCKSLRTRWFRNPQNISRHIPTKAVPSLVLPKKDFRHRDGEIDFRLLDPERQRCVERGTKISDEGVRIVQWEVFSRESDLYYQVLGLQRAIVEWQNIDPQKLLKEDPREEVFFSHLRHLEKSIVFVMDRFRINALWKTRYVVFLNFLRVSTLILIALLLFIGISNARNYPSQLFLSNWLRSPQTISAAAFAVSNAFVFEIGRRRKNMNMKLEKLRSMQEACKILSGDLVVFRLDTNNRRAVGGLVDFEKIVTKKIRKTDFNEIQDDRVVQSDVLSFDSWLKQKQIDSVDDKESIRKAIEKSKELIPQRSPNIQINRVHTFQRSLDPSQARNAMTQFFRGPPSPPSTQTASERQFTNDSLSQNIPDEVSEAYQSSEEDETVTVPEGAPV